MNEEDEEEAFEQRNKIKEQENNNVNLCGSRWQPKCSLVR